MAFSAMVLVLQAASANAALQAQGHGPANFTVPMKPIGQAIPATHTALHHLATDPAFEAHVAALPGVSLVQGEWPNGLAAWLLEILT